eukprot:CAMPEP_0179127100 /NCGR_PEP_ID=MMETSP0796-20121207/60194_1 /TAXON_ID=73915 /ORGANISM="Pyrodinium bahamense, Strain pbaha01" /LENGTH=613 /DNA_ID=CAMNT_0020825877 /DNA_START=10 /DNA_END=1851 /DNA_ORIENTATION=-
MAEDSKAADDVEYPGVRWVKANYILLFLEDGQPMPRCQDLPPKAFGPLGKAVRVFSVTHPWLGRWHPDPQGIQMETLRAKLKKLKNQMMLDQDDVVFFDYMSLPQVSIKGIDDRTAVEKQRLASALSGDLMGRIYLTTRVIIIDEVPNDAECATPYLNRGWCYFECIMTAINTSPRDLSWVDKSVKDEIARFREMSALFRESGDISPLVEAFQQALPTKTFAKPSDTDLVRGFFTSLAISQRLVAAAARGDVQGVLCALDDGADPRSRNGQGRTALQVAAMNRHVAVLAAILRRTGASVAAMKTMENETTLQVAREAGSLECQFLLMHWLGERTLPALMVSTLECDEAAVRRLLLAACGAPGDSGAEAAAAAAAAEAAAPTAAAVAVREVPGPQGAAAAAALAASGVACGRAVPKTTAAGRVPAPKQAAAKPATAAAAGASRAKATAPRSETPSGRARQMAPAAKASGPPRAKATPLSRGSAMRSAARLVLEPASPTPPAVSAEHASVASPQSNESAGDLANAVELASAADTAVLAVAKPVVPADPELVDVHAQDDIGNTALSYAVSLRLMPIVKVLIEARADAELCNHDGDSPVAMAMRTGDAKLLETLQRV